MAIDHQTNSKSDAQSRSWNDGIITILSLFCFSAQLLDAADKQEVLHVNKVYIRQRGSIVQAKASKMRFTSHSFPLFLLLILPFYSSLFHWGPVSVLLGLGFEATLCLRLQRGFELKFHFCVFLLTFCNLR